MVLLHFDLKSRHQTLLVTSVCLGLGLGLGLGDARRSYTNST